MEPSDWIRLSLLARSLSKPIVSGCRAAGGPDAFLAASLTARAQFLGGLHTLGKRKLEAALGASVETELKLLSETGALILPYDSNDYPASLHDLPDAPPCLFALGSPSCLQRRCVAIVGSRASAHYGLDLARAMGDRLASAGVCVVSGLARGVDAAAHLGALDGGGLTAAVLGCGVDHPYPRTNKELRARIVAEGGAVLTELPPGTEPSRETFPHRNRIVAALSLLTVVVGASESSGALITANAALELGREVAAVPGSIRDPFSRGAHQLIRDGAHVVTCADDVLALLGVGASPAAVKLDLDSLSPDERRIFDVLTHSPAHLDAIADSSGLSHAATLAALTMLVARGLAEARPGGCYVRAV